MQVHDLFNRTEHLAALGFAQDPDGRDVAVALLKATWRFSVAGGLPTRARDEQRIPIFLADRFADDAGQSPSPLRFASDLTSHKPGTDVAVVGHAYGWGAREASAGFQLGALAKVLRVHGRRALAQVLHRYVIGEAQAFDKLSVGYENAYGGRWADDQGRLLPYPMNPAGKGAFCPDGGTEAPHLEAPDHPYLGPNRAGIEPAALGFIPAGWQQRARFAGTFDAEWMAHRRPLLPKDFDPRFYNTVAQDQVLRGGLRGGEELTLLGLHPQAKRIKLTMPRLGCVAEFVVRSSRQRVPMVADTLLVLPDAEKDAGKLAVTLRASCPMEVDIRYLRSVTVAELPEGRAA